MKEKLSIVVPVYNNEKFLDKCLTSIINQTYQNLEIILVNDGSKDNSLKIMEEYAKKDSRIIIIDKENGGVSSARNDGIKRSTGEYITFVDSDDYIELNEIEEMYNAIKENNVDMVRTNYQVRYKNSDILDIGNLSTLNGKKLNEKEIKTTFLPKILDGSIPCFVYLFMVKRELLLKTNLFLPDIHMMEDVVLYIDLITKIKSIYILDKPLYNIFFNEEGATNSFKNCERNILNIINVNKYIIGILNNKKLLTSENSKLLCLSHINAIVDFFVKYYVYDKKKSINLMKKLSEDEYFTNMVIKIDFKEISFSRRVIIKNIKKKNWKLLKFWLCVRKFIFQLRSRK